MFHPIKIRSSTVLRAVSKRIVSWLDEALMVIEDTDRLGRTLQRVAKKLTVLQAQHDEHLKATKGRFSLFTVLLEESDETRLHSRYLAHLLNPSGTHDCGTRFLELFLKVLREKGVEPREDQFDLKEIKVGCEVCVHEGRLDILIESPEWGAIAIENKIWAGEQPEQLARYASYLNRQYPHRSRTLLYLTLDGEASNTANGSKYYRISYREHILDWLEECLRATYQHVNINQALQQYKNVVSQLVRRSTWEPEYMEKMKEVVRANPDIVAARTALNEAVEQLREEYRNKLLAGLETQLRDRGMQFEKTNTEGGNYCRDWVVKRQVKFGATTCDIRIQADSSGGGLELRNGVIEEVPGLYEFVKSTAPELKYHNDAGWNGGYYDVSEGDCLSDDKLTQLLESTEELQKEELQKIVSGWVSRIGNYVNTVVKMCK
jgi:hypothetical protein